MRISLQDAVNALYQIVVVNGKTQSPNRLRKLADFCVQELNLLGVSDAAAEVPVRGVGRTKNWDVGWPASGKARLAISLKSILKNLPGTVPNRVDDLMGEASNVQLISPEIVVGYLMLFNVGEPRGNEWLTTLNEDLQRLSGRRSPSWGSGMVEGYCIVAVDFSRPGGPLLLTPESDVIAFLHGLAEQVRDRNW